MSTLFVELLVSGRTAAAIAKNFDPIVSIFKDEMLAMGYQDLALTVLTFSSSTENTIIKVSDPYTRSWTDEMSEHIHRAWTRIAAIIAPLAGGTVYNDPTSLFSTSIPE